MTRSPNPPDLPDVTDMPEMDIVGFILTGGSSQRMGHAKGLLDIGGQPLALRLHRLLGEVGISATLVGTPERYAHLGVPVLADLEEGRGPLAGIVTALVSTQSGWSFVLACDLPYLDHGILSFLAGLALEAGRAGAAGADAVVPRIEGRWQPLCALYHHRCLPAFRQVLESDHPKITDAYESLRIRSVEEGDLTRAGMSVRGLENMNTPEQYEEARIRFG